MWTIQTVQFAAHPHQQPSHTARAHQCLLSDKHTWSLHQTTTNTTRPHVRFKIARLLLLHGTFSGLGIILDHVVRHERKNKTTQRVTPFVRRFGPNPTSEPTIKCGRSVKGDLHRHVPATRARQSYLISFHMIVWFQCMNATSSRPKATVPYDNPNSRGCRTNCHRERLKVFI